MSCSSCKYLDASQKKEGASGGCCYYCKKRKSFVNGSNDACDVYETSYTRNNYECNQIYEDGKHYSNDTTPISLYIILLVFLIVIGLIFNVFDIFG